LAIVWFRVGRYWGIKNLKVMQHLLLKMGMLPVVDHYYEPLIDYRKWPKETSKTSLTLDAEAQLNFIRPFSFQDELKTIPVDEERVNRFFHKNGSFETGDAELYYSIIRHAKPARILEVGSGFSTLIALEAVAATKTENQNFSCELICIEPYEMDFLESVDVKLIRQVVEQVDISIFLSLRSGDILFIDSSHIIRPGGDVTYLILEILPKLAAGVLIHFHDIFIPKHYPVEWLKNEYRLWNEQYLLEAFLSGNNSFEIVCALNFLLQNNPNNVYSKFPLCAKEQQQGAASFWIRKVK